MDATSGLLRQFCADLRLLWTQAGGPSLRTLAAQVGLGKSQVGAILQGDVRHLPDWNVVRGLVDGFRRYADDHGRVASLSLSTGVDEFWRPRYTMLEHSSTSLTPLNQAIASTRVVPRQLPPAIRHLAGRSSEMDCLSRLLDGGGNCQVTIAVVDGTAGVGKTTLAVAWAHRVADRFGDGQLYFNLRGFDPGGYPSNAGEVIRAFLDALDVAPQRVPSGFDAQVGLYRSLLAGRRLLVVLDNARDAEQVRPLLPGTPGCAVVVTSRNRLPSLVAGEGAHPLTLDLLSDVDALELLSGRLGPADPCVLDGIVKRCAGLPLALAVVAGHAAMSPGAPLEAIADELDPGGDLASVFDLSYRTLSPGAARLLRLLGLHPGPDLGPDAAASLAGVPRAETRALLAELTRANLLSHRAPDRYALHDLLRAYAAELAATNDSEAERSSARHRFFDHYLHTAYRAMVVLDPLRDRIAIAEARPGAVVIGPKDRQEALAWHRTEQSVLLNAVKCAVDTGFDRHAWQLAWALSIFFDNQGRWHELGEAHRLGAEAARRLGEPRLEAMALRQHGRSAYRLGRHEESYEQLSRAVAIFRELDDGVEEAHTQHQLSMVLHAKHRSPAALECARRSLRLFEAASHPVGQAKALNMMALSQHDLGRHRAAIRNCRKGLNVSADPQVQGHTLDTMGMCHLRLGELDRAIENFSASLAIFRMVADRFFEAEVLIHLGDAHAAAGDRASALHAWRESLVILEDLGHVDAPAVRARLANG